jgi:transcriptional/translational regulatory protein YebC/TACO1
MGFHTRHIGHSNLLAHAKNPSESFKTYMLNADSYDLTDDSASCFWNLYHEEKDLRESIQNVLLENDERIIEAIVKSYVMVDHRVNTEDQIESIHNYLDLIKGSDDVNRIVNSIRKRIK